jgi:chromosome segregation ATPase
VLGVQDLGSRDPNGVVTAGPWLPRDGTVADTAITIDRLTAKIERLERREEALQKQVAELVELSHQAGRFQALAESLRNSRDYKIEETTRLVRDLRGRIDAIEGPKGEYSGRTHRTLVAIDRKLAELSEARAEAGCASKLRRRIASGALMAAAVGAFVTTVVAPLL